MLDIKFLRENTKLVKESLKKRESHFDLDKLLEVDEKRRDFREEIDNLRAEKNKLSSAQNKESGEQAKGLKEKIRQAEEKLVEIEKEFNHLMLLMPNIVDESVPTECEVVLTWGEKPKFDFEPKDHAELGKALDIIDIERATKLSGSRFGLLKREAALLEFALVRFVFDHLAKKGFVPVVPPTLVREKAMFGTGFFPAEENEYYKTALDDLYLIGTSEVPLAGMHMDEILPKESLPLKYCGFSTCYRREAGAYGKDTKGIFRVHQFDKVEMFIYTEPQTSWGVYEELRKTAEEIVQLLGFHYQLINIPANDLGAPNAKKYDIEAWIPSQNQFREIVSCSHDTDFQARRLNIRYKNSEGKNELVHTMNSTAVAVQRTLIAIMENYQQKDGSIKIPEVLIPYLNFERIER